MIAKGKVWIRDRDVEFSQVQSYLGKSYLGAWFENKFLFLGVKKENKILKKKPLSLLSHEPDHSLI